MSLTRFEGIDAPVLVPKVEIIAWADRLPFTYLNRITSLMADVHNAIGDRNIRFLRRLSRVGSQMPMRITQTALAFVERGDIRSAARGPQIALECLFQRSLDYSHAMQDWLQAQAVNFAAEEEAEERARAQAAKYEEISQTDGALASIERLSLTASDDDRDLERGTAL